MFNTIHLYIILMNALDILYHHATRNISPKYTVAFARLALTHKSGCSEPIVTMTRSIVASLSEELASAVTKAHPRLPPVVDIDKVLRLLPLFSEWNANPPQDVLNLTLHDMVLLESVSKDIDRILDAGANINAIHEECYFPPLMIAARKGNSALVKHLLKRGADIHLTVCGLTALDHALGCGHTAVVDVLGEYGCMEEFDSFLLE